MEGGADDSTNRTIEEASLTPERANTPEIPPPPPPTTIKPNESINLNDTIIDRNDCGNNTVKPTFKNLQQAKKRLHAFSVQKLNQLPTSPLAKKVRLDEKIDETAKKTPKRHKDPNEKAKAVIEEIEEIKRNEQAYLESVRASIDKEHFKKIEKKSRHIRKRSPSLDKSKKINITINNNINESSSNKEKKRYPKNWKELQELELSFDELNREFDLPPPKGNNDVPRQLLFELPSLPIVETKIKTLNREDRLVPFQFVRFTKCKPIISFSINFNTIKEKYPSRRTVLETIPKEMAANIEKLHSTSLKFKTDFNIKVRNWFPKSWINYNHECKLLENSVGLSFLQSYTEDEDNEPASTNNNNNSKIDNSGNNIESSNISNKNKEKNIKKTMKKKKKSNKKRSETKKKQKRSKTEEKLKKKKKKKKHTKEKKHRSDEKIEDIDDKNAKNVDKIDDENVEIENDTKDEMKIETINDEIDNQQDNNEEIEEDRCIKTTPDTEDYHSHWESDDDLTKIKPLRPSIKLNRSWESDEELFERSGNSNNNTNDNNNSNNKRKQCDYNNLEIPLNLTNLITRKSINIIDNNNDEEPNNENNNKMEILKPVNLKLDLDMMKTDNNNSLNLENQYEEFIKAVSTDSSSFNQQQIEDNNDNNKQLIVSNSDNVHNNNNNNVADDDGGDSSSSDTSTSTSSSSTTSSSTSTSSDNSSTNRNDNNLANNNSKKKKKKKYKLKKSKRKRNKIQDIFNEFDIPVPSDLPDVGNGGNNGNNVLPLPVPSPDQTLLSTTNNDGVDLKKPFIFPTITIQSKKTLLDHTKLKLNDDSDSCDFTEKFLKKSNEIVPEDFPITTTTTMIENEDVKKIKQDKKQTNDNRKREQRNHRDQRDRDSKHKNSTKKPLRRRYSSPLLRRYSPTTMKRRHLSPILSQKQRRKSPSSPSRYRRSPKRKRSRSPKSRQITTTTTKRALSPINSPLDGFKKSVADSTISDDMLPQPSSTIDDYSQSPISTYNNNNNSINIATKFFDKCDNISSMIDNKNGNNHNNSPKRLSLDDRINQVLGLEKIDNNDNKQQQIDNYHDYNNYHQYDQQYYGQYPQNYTNYNLTPVQQSQTTKVVQVGNILQVVPTDEVPHNLIDNKTPETGHQKIVQVGNMLQIVPAVLQPTTTIIDNTTPTTIETTPIINQDENNQQIEEYLMKQKSLERKAEREKRRLERTRRRKEKEKKRKEREKRRQLKLKLKTENMIKKALQLEAETLFDEDDDVENSTQWPPIQVVVSTSSDAPNKGILQTGGFTKIDGKKSVQFADGIRPGEGTSPSGGEELSSPPPKTTKRHKKIKLPKKSKKKKIKVKVKRIQQQQQQPQENGIDDNVGGNDDDNDEDYENLPPPSPPPGSPPPHVFPSRVKEPPFNNINPYIVTNPAYVTNYPRQTLPPSQIMINRPPYMAGSFHPDLHQNSFVGTNHGIPSHH